MRFVSGKINNKQKGDTMCCLKELKEKFYDLRFKCHTVQEGKTSEELQKDTEYISLLQETISIQAILVKENRQIKEEMQIIHKKLVECLNSRSSEFEELSAKLDKLTQKS